MSNGSGGAINRRAAALDVIIVVLAAVAVVSALGADTRLRMAGIRLSAAEVWRPVLLAGALALVRWRRFREAPILGVSRGTHLLGDPAEPVAIAERSMLPPRFGIISVVLIVAALWPIRAQVADLHSVPDLEDPLFSAWRVGWFAHQIVADPAHLFDANIFHPAPLTLTYSDAHLLPSTLAAPLIWLGVDALVASNVLFAAAFPLAALAYCAATWRLVGDVRAAVIAGLLAAWSPFHFEHISHLELQWFCWIPLAIVALHAAVARGGWGRGAALGGALAAQALSSMYFGLMLAAYLVPFAVCLLAGWRIRPGGRHARAAAAAALLALAPTLILGPPYLGSRAARGDRHFKTVAEFSAEGRDYGIPNIHSATWGHRLGSDRKVERALFPGATPLTLAAIGLVPPLTVTRVAAVVSGAFAFDWSLGVNGLTFDELRRLLVPVRGLRVPARFVVLVATSLILLAAFGVRRLLAHVPAGAARHAVFAVIVLLAWVDLRPSFRLVPAWPQPPPVYAAVDSSMVLAEFPMRFDWNISYMYFSTTHWAKLLNGYSGFLPDTFVNLQNALGAFPRPEALALVRRQGATHLTVNCRFYGGDHACAPVLAALGRHGAVRLITTARWEGSEVRLYEIR
jgi:hypothetical protein